MAEHTPDKGCLNTGNDSCPDASELHAPERGGDWSPVVERLLAFRAVVSLRNWAGPGHGWKPGGSLRPLPPLDGCGFCPCSASLVSGREPCWFTGRRGRAGALKVVVTIRELTVLFLFVFEVFCWSVVGLALNSRAQAILLPHSQG